MKHWEVYVVTKAVTTVVVHSITQYHRSAPCFAFNCPKNTVNHSFLDLLLYKPFNAKNVLIKNVTNDYSLIQYVRHH